MIIGQSALSLFLSLFLSLSLSFMGAGPIQFMGKSSACKKKNEKEKHFGGWKGKKDIIAGQGGSWVPGPFLSGETSFSYRTREEEEEEEERGRRKGGGGGGGGRAGGRGINFRQEKKRKLPWDHPPFPSLDCPTSITSGTCRN